MKDLEPGYISLYQSGELERRARALEARLAACDICPRECGANRLEGKVGKCHSGILPIVASFCAHRGEEPALSGSRGSGTIFFGNCNIRCVYCQNFQISQSPEIQKNNEVSTQVLAERMLYLQNELHCHNINLVTPSHFVPQIVMAVLEAVPKGLRLPLVYNTSSYDSVKTLRELDGIISIYLADIRYASNELGRKYSRSRNYADNARAAIIEMQRQADHSADGIDKYEHIRIFFLHHFGNFLNRVKAVRVTAEELAHMPARIKVRLAFAMCSSWRSDATVSWWCRTAIRRSARAIT